MVAYSFKAQFAEPIATLKKRQTVRGNRRRHARPGEPLQLYTAMRTKHCRKLLDHDPVCIDVRPIRLILDASHPNVITSLWLDGVYLNATQMEEFAIADGFDAGLADGWALRRMGHFWRNEHQWENFGGVVIRWDPIVG